MGKSKNIKNISYAQKLQIMIEYLKTTGGGITSSTVYNGYKIGEWRNNIRYLYKRGEAKIEPELLEKYKQYGIIIEGNERRNKTSLEYRINFLIENVGDRNAVTNTGRQYSVVRQEIQHLYNTGKLRIGENRLIELQKLGILRKSQNEQQYILARYPNVPAKIALEIDEKYGSLENYIKEFKNGNAPRFDTLEMFMGHRFIMLSERDITQKEKNMYYKIAQNIFGELPFDSYIDIDKLEECINELPPEERRTIEDLFLKQKLSRVELARLRGITSEAIRQNTVRAIKHLRERKDDFKSTAETDKIELKKLQDKRKNINDILADLMRLEAYLTNNYEQIKDDLNEGLNLESLGITGAAFVVNSNNITIGDLTKNRILKKSNYEERTDNNIELYLPKGIRRKLSNVGIYTIEDLLEETPQSLLSTTEIRREELAYIQTELAEHNLTLNKDKSTQNSNRRNIRLYKMCKKFINGYKQERTQIEIEMAEIEDRIRRYNVAKEYFMENEDVLNETAIIPANLTEELRFQIKYSIENGEIELEIIRNVRKKEREQILN